MRLIGTLAHENEARRFTAYLKRQGIDANCEVSFEAATNRLSYHLWIHDEDQIAPAMAAFERFESSPSDSEFDAPAIQEPPSAPQGAPPLERAAVQPRGLRAPITSFFLGVCAFLFVLSWYQEQKILFDEEPQGNLLMTPVDRTLFFDLPPSIDEIGSSIEKNTSKHSLPEDIKKEADALNQMTYWHGIYDWGLNKLKGKDTRQDEGPLFYKIRQGEVWRLFTPVLLHGGLLHILFNMIWLWVLGVPIEQRIGALRTIFLTLVLGIGSNVSQYLMGGPFFIGYSGIVVGLAGFIWAREKTAPWEGYPLQRSTILFLLLFVGSMFAIQATSFILQLFSDISFSPNIANTGHISGGILGILLGRLSFFAARAR